MAKNQGVFIGKGISKDSGPSFMAWGAVAIKQDGTVLDESTLPEGARAEGHPEFSYRGALALEPGKIQYLPVWDEKLLRAAVSSENFAKPGMADQIKQWLEQGIDSYFLLAKVKEAKGLLTLKDVGLESEDTTAPATPSVAEVPSAG